MRNRKVKTWLTKQPQLWLLGYEFPATLFILTPELLQIVTTKKKGALEAVRFWWRNSANTAQPRTWSL